MKKLLSFIMLFAALSAQARTQAEAEKMVDALMQELTLDEKLSLMHGFGVGKSEFGDVNSKAFGVAGIERLGIPPVYMGHGITGTRVGRDQKVRSTYVCTPIAMGSSWDVELYGKVGEAVAREMRALGQDLNLGPTLNIIRNPLGGRTWESYAEDPYLSAQMIIPYAKAMQSNGIICGPKHYAANNQELNRFDINNVMDERTLREIYLPAFEAAVKQGGVLNIMGAYNMVNGEFMCHNKFLLTDILRKEWGFQGFVLSDFGQAVRNTVDAAMAGLNTEMHGKEFYGPKMKEEIQKGNLSMDIVDNLVKEYLRVVYMMEVDSRDRATKDVVHSQQILDLAREVAASSQVLLKNSGILPLDANKAQKIAVIGPNAKKTEVGPKLTQKYYFLQGGGSGRTYFFDNVIVEPLTGIQQATKAAVSYAQGTFGAHANRRKQQNKSTSENQVETQLIDDAAALAKSSDVVIMVMGLTGVNESEGHDRTSAKLPDAQEALIKKVSKLNDKVIVCVVSGSYIDVSAWQDKVEAIVYVPYCGEQIGHGMADVLFGKVSPSGKLSTTWPKSIDDYPKGSIFTGGGYSKEKKDNVYSEGIFVGYRWFDKENIEPAYPFGYGLTYSEFEYSNIKAKKSGGKYIVSIDVKNTGNYDAKEVVQLYVSDVKSTHDRPKQELKGFKKVALAKGEMQTVSFVLEDDAFSYFNPDKKVWAVEKGEFIVSIGASSRDLKHTVKLKK